MTIIKKTLLFVSYSSLVLYSSINSFVAITIVEYDDPNTYINDFFARGLPYQED